MFPPIEYLEWIVGRPERAAYDLGSSDLRAARPPVETFDGDVDDPIAYLEGILAAEYGVDQGRVLVTAGATHANFLAFATALDATYGADPDDEATTRPRVLVEKPGYEPLRATPEGLGAQIDRFVRPVEDGYPLEPDRVAAAAHEGTSLVVVTNRHNPSGVETDRATLEETARAAEREGATLLVDEVYAPFTLEPDPAAPFGGVTAAGLPNTVVTSSLTKFFGLGSLRIGWLIGPPEFVDRARTVSWHVPAVSEQNARRAAVVLEDASRLAERSRTTLAENHDLLASFVGEREDVEGFVAPDNSFAFPSHARADGNAVVEAAWERGVLVVPGRFFDAPGRFRVSLGGDPAASREGLAVLGETLDEL